MDYSESICFSAAPAEALNKKAFILNRSLFLFAYYEPKPYCKNDSSRSKFVAAIINLYGLFWDCGPFVFELLRTKDSILLNNWKSVQAKARTLKICVSAFRSFFCHNNSNQFPLNEEKTVDAINWASEHGVYCQEIDTITEAEWDMLLGQLATMADSLIADIDVALDGLLVTSDLIRRDGAIDRWIQQIARKYKNNPDYLLNTMVCFYQLYLLNSNSDLYNSMRVPTVKWICSICSVDNKKWYEKWLYATESDDCDSDDITNLKVYTILKDWPNKWAEWNGCSADDCDEAPMPASVFFRILASDVDRIAHDPSLIKAALTA